MSIGNSQSYTTNELLVPDRMKKTARKKLKLSSTSKKVSITKETVSNHLLDGSHIQNFRYVKRKIHFYYQEVVRARSSTPYFFFPKCNLHHCRKELFAIFFCSTSTISLLWNICISVLGHNLSMGKLRPCTPNEKQWHL